MIHLIITAANIKEHYNDRKEQYLKSIESVLKFDYLFDSYTVLECASENEEYLADYNVHYSKVKNRFKEKGLNEMQHLKAFIEGAAFNNDDLIIKFTGRYIMEDNSFLNKVRLLMDDYDSIFKDDGDIYKGQGYHTFLYAMKKPLFLETINSLNFTNENLDPIEWGVKDFLKNRDRNYVLSRLGIMAFQGTDSNKVFRS
jgi:hypothetical protein